MKTKNKYQIRKHKILFSCLLFFLIVILYTAYGLLFRYSSPPSFLPLLEIDRGYSNGFVSKINYADYSIGLNRAGQLLIQSDKDRVKILYYFRCTNKSGKLFEKLVDNFRISYLKNDTLVIECAEQQFHTKIEFIFNRGNNTVGVNINTIFTDDINLVRSSLILLPFNRVNSFTKKNGMIEKVFAADEYWIGKGGLIEYGRGAGKFLLNGGSLSSIQIETTRNEVWLNADYDKDHPNIHIIKNGKGKWIDKSPNEYKKGDSIISSFSILPGIDIDTYPKLMTNPGGYLAAIIFTEHADNTILETNKAVYFGSGGISNAGDATGGFIKYKIPVTKSIFYSNWNGLDNLAFNSEISDLQLSLEGNPDYLKFLQEIYHFGQCEIALHTTDPSDDKIDKIDSALSFLKNEFNISTWIDHGMSDGFINRESFTADGLDSNSENYMTLHWDKYGIKYFWNSAIEKEKDCGALKSKLMNVQIIDFIHCYLERIMGDNNLLRSEEGEQVPAPCYWQNNNINHNFYSWGTLRHSGHFPGWIWNYVYRETSLNNFVNDRGVNIIHFYPAFVGDKLGYSNGIVEKNGEAYNINKNFDDMLKRLAGYRDRQKINLTTINDFLNYQLAKQNIETVAISNHRYKIINRNSYSIEGVSFSVDSGYNIRTNKAYNYKRIGQELIFWFDMGPGEVVEFEEAAAK